MTSLPSATAPGRCTWLLAAATFVAVLATAGCSACQASAASGPTSTRRDKKPGPATRRQRAGGTARRLKPASRAAASNGQRLRRIRRRRQARGPVRPVGEAGYQQHTARRRGRGRRRRRRPDAAVDGLRQHPPQRAVRPLPPARRRHVGDAVDQRRGRRRVPRLQPRRPADRLLLDALGHLAGLRDGPRRAQRRAGDQRADAVRPPELQPRRQAARRTPASARAAGSGSSGRRTWTAASRR